MATFSIRKNKTHSSAESQFSVSFILTPKCSWHQVAPPKLCLHTKTGNTPWLRKRPISNITASSAKPKRCEGNLLSYIPTDIFSISLETSGNFFPGQRRQLVTITQSYGKPLGCRERQRSLLMPVKQQSFGYALKTTQDRRKGLKKISSHRSNTQGTWIQESARSEMFDRSRVVLPDLSEISHNAAGQLFTGALKWAFSFQSWA